MGKVIHKYVYQWKDKELSNIAEAINSLEDYNNDRRKDRRKRYLYKMISEVTQFLPFLDEHDMHTLQLAKNMLYRDVGAPNISMVIRTLQGIIKRKGG